MNLLGESSLSAALGLVALALVPVALVTLTSFAKISVVFSALRNALGTPDVPSGTVITALSLALSVYVMAPLAVQIEQRVAAQQKGESALQLPDLLALAAEPAQSFLSKHAGKRETQLLVELGKQRPVPARATDLSVLWAAFALSELKHAFTLAFFVFLPFLVLDLVIAHLLLALGMQGLTPSAVALPFKLLLFASVDGFLLVSRALILGYG